MTKIVRTFLLLLLVVAMVPLVGSHPSAQAREKVTLHITNWAGVDEAAEFQKIVDKVNSEATDFEVVYEPKPADYYTWLQTALAGDSAPDLFWLDQDHMNWAYQGPLLDISKYLAKDTRGAADSKDYYPGIWQTVAFNNGVYGLPWIAQPVVLYYNKAIFDEMGVAYPTADWTWDQFKEAAVKLTNDQHYGFSMNGWPPVHMFIWSFGGEVISEDLKTSPIDSPEAMAGAQFYADMIWNPACCPSEKTITEQGFADMFKAGKVAMFMGGAADDLDRVEGLNVGISPVPKGTKGENTTFAWTAATVINAKTKYPDQAYEALIALTDGIQNWKIVSPRISQATVEHLVASEPRKKDNAAAIMAAVPYMRAFRIIPRYDEWNTVFWDDFQNKLYHKEDTIQNLAPDARILLEDLLPK